MNESSAPFKAIPKGNENVVWILPMICTIEYAVQKGRYESGSF